MKLLTAALLVATIAVSTPTVRDLFTGKETTSPVILPANRFATQYMPSPSWMSDSKHVLIMAEDGNHVLFLYKVDPFTGAGVELDEELSAL